MGSPPCQGGRRRANGVQPAGSTGSIPGFYQQGPNALRPAGVAPSRWIGMREAAAVRLLETSEPPPGRVPHWQEGVAEAARQLGFGVDGLLRAFCRVAETVHSGHLPGAVVAVGRSGGPIAGPVAFGYRSLWPRPEPMTPDTLFDLASLTKPVATAAVTMALVDRGEVHLAAPVADYLPAFSARDSQGLRRQVRLWHLLTHTSGLPAWTPLYDPCRPGAALPAGNRPPAECRPAMEARLLELPLERPPGARVVYSCLGFILLGLVLERAAGQPLDRLAARWVFEPLGMTRTTFCPPPHLEGRCAATERCAIRQVVVRGVVHDENAYFFGGVAGNAGLFAPADDLARFARMMLRRGEASSSGDAQGRTSAGMGDPPLPPPGARVLSPAAVEAMTRNHTSHLNEPRGLGWAIRGHRIDSAAGDLFSPQSYGHTGFTGTSLWVDPVRDVWAVLLTNRVHPTRHNDVHLRLRPAFHNAVASALR